MGENFLTPFISTYCMSRISLETGSLTIGTKRYGQIKPVPFIEEIIALRYPFLTIVVHFQQPVVRKYSSYKLTHIH